MSPPPPFNPFSPSNDAAKTEKSKKRSCLSGRSKKFWIILGVISLVLTIGLAVGLGVGLTRNKDDDNSDDNDETQFFPPSANNTNSTLGSYWQPSAGLTWQIILQSPITSTAPNVSVYDIDLFENNSTLVKTLHSQGRKVICYFSAGSYEDFRDDADQFKKSDRGSALKNWPGEYWLNTNSTNVRRIMRSRLDLAKNLGCDGVDPDNLDGYDNNPGFPLTTQTAIDYLTFLAIEAHSRGLAIGLKNSGKIVDATVGFLQWVVNEQCVAFGECGMFRKYIQMNKPVFHIEYPKGAGSAGGVEISQRNAICGDPSRTGFSTVMKTTALNDWLETC
ncbi:glycoside hydrolase superfamily [Halenospora varia]|nr:glycoside hydrolase superfamily [Halenospora varia]